MQDKSKQESAENISHTIALAELLAYIDEARKDENITVFKLADLCKLYSTHFEQLVGEQHDHLHSTHMKNCILAHFPDLTAHKEGHDILLAFNNDLGAALHRSFVITTMMMKLLFSKSSKHCKKRHAKNASIICGLI